MFFLLKLSIFYVIISSYARRSCGKELFFMIPKFPEFKKIELSDKKDVEKFTQGFPPYSDFNFVSMWIWNIHDKMMLSQLNGNLVVLFVDYVSKEYFLSFIGINKITETALELINFSREKYQVNFLKLVPEEIANGISEIAIEIKPDRDSFDYIYSIAHLASMDSWSKNTSGKTIRKFIKSNLDYTVKHLSTKEILKNEYREFFKKWAYNKKIDEYFDLNEYKAFERLLMLDSEEIRFLSLYIDNILVGFTVYEILSNDFIVSHFAKFDIKYSYTISDILNWEEAKVLNKKGIKYCNWEQDLGLLSLRKAKEKYKPDFLLKKFIIDYNL